MRKLGLALVAIFAAMSLLGGCTSKPQKSSGKMLVAASIGPLGNFSKEVGGNLVDVQVLVQPGASPHTYQLSADQMEMLSQASVLVLNGLHLEFWADKAINAADNPKLIVVHTADGLPVIEGKDEEQGDVHPGGNPHVWLNPMYAIHQVETIRDAFIKADPSHKSQYTKNAADYVAKLRKLDEDIRTEVATFKSRDFITFHPTWVYFAREYGLVEAAAIEKSPGREPSPSEIGDIVDLCKREHIRAIFAEPQFSPKAAEVVADECGARVLMLNTIGQPPDFNYIKMMRDNVNEMAKALK